jgi:tetratricopeptide (TPR) repeat protein
MGSNAAEQEDQKYAMTVLSRLATRCPEEIVRLERLLEGRLDRLADLAVQVATGGENAIGIALARAIERSASPGQARRISQSIPSLTTTLLEAAVVAEQRAGEMFDREGVAGKARERVERLLGLGERLRNLGRLGAALSAIEAATALARKLLNGDVPTAHCLNDLSEIIAQQGNPIKALQAASEAEKLLEPLFKSNADLHRHAYANNCLLRGTELAALGRDEEALAAAMQALALFETEVSKGEPDSSASLAAAHHSVAARLEKLGRLEQGLGHARESCSIYRDLFDERPDAFRERYARSLNLFGTFLLGAGDMAGAQLNLNEAEFHFRQLSASHPDVFGWLLPSLLVHKAQLLRELKQWQPAFDCLDEAASTYRVLASTEPDRFRRRLGETYAVQSTVYQESGNLREALTANEKAIILQAEFFLNAPLMALSAMRVLLVSYRKTANSLGALPIPRLIERLEDAVDALGTQLGGNFTQSGNVFFKLDTEFLDLIFEEEMASSVRFPEESSIREAAASAGVQTVSIALTEGELDKARAALVSLARLQSVHPHDAYVLEEYAAALWSYVREVSNKGEFSSAFGIYELLESLAVSYPGSVYVCHRLSVAGFHLIGNAQILEIALQLNSVLQGLCIEHPEDEELRVNAAKGAVNLLTRADLSERQSFEAHQWIWEQLDSFPSAALRGLLATASLYYLRLASARSDIEVSVTVYGELDQLARQYSDESTVVEMAAQGAAVLVDTYVRSENLDEAQSFFDEYCRHMPVARICRLQRVQALRTLAYGYSVAHRQSESSHCVDELLRAVGNERADEDFVSVAQEIKSDFKFNEEHVADTNSEVTP